MYRWLFRLIDRRKLSSNHEEDRRWNVIVDKIVNPVEAGKIDDLCEHVYYNIDENSFWEWLSQTNLSFKNLDYIHKKALEFFFSTRLLEICPSDSLLDAAGGRSGYLDAVRSSRVCSSMYLTDHIYSGDHKSTQGITTVGGDIGCIDLPDQSLTKIACHHAFEHFQEDKDIGFIGEISRLLKPGGRACIIPLFLTEDYIECWNIDHRGLYDNNAQLIIDKSASIPGGQEDGHFARFYSPEAFKKRILLAAQSAKLNPGVITCQLNGRDLPDMDKNFGSLLNYPLRALLLEKSHE